MYINYFFVAEVSKKGRPIDEILKEAVQESR